MSERRAASMACTICSVRALLSGGKRFVDIGLAQSFAEVAVRAMNAAAPAGQLLFGSSESVREEVEVFIHQCFGQERR